MNKFEFMQKMLSDEKFEIQLGKDFIYAEENKTKDDLTGDIYCRLVFSDLNISGFEDNVIIEHKGPCVPSLIRDAYNSGYHKHTSFEDYSKEQLVKALEAFLEFETNHRRS